jgi:hypothetical protein
MTRQGQAAATNWARANRLAELSGLKPAAARNFIKDIDEDTKILLDEGADKRNKIIRQLIEDAQSGDRPSLGDPDKPARAGAPTRRIPTTKCDNTSIDLLIDIKKLADKHGGLESISKGLAALQRLRD